MKHNQPTLTDEVTLTMRGLCHKRAICMYRVLENAEAEGMDPAFLWKSLREYGYDTGKNIEKAMDDPSDLAEFSRHFGVGLDRNIYEMETVEANDKRFELKFHYCPFVEKWRMLGIPEEKLPRLCDLAMQGDHGVGEIFEMHGIHFTLGRTIADGNPTCDLLFTKEDGNA